MVQQFSLPLVFLELLLDKMPSRASDLEDDSLFKHPLQRTQRALPDQRTTFGSNKFQRVNSFQLQKSREDKDRSHYFIRFAQKQEKYLLYHQDLKI